jgi:hypothetical protein
VRIALGALQLSIDVFDLITLDAADYAYSSPAAVNIARRLERREPLFGWEKRPA